MLTEVYPRLFVGNIKDSKNFNGVICCVLERNFTKPDGNGGSMESEIRKDALNFPVFNDVVGEFDIVQLELLARFINRSLKSSNSNFLIHCGAGWERSPFAMAYTIWRTTNEFLTLQNAYDYVKEKHSDTRDVSAWIPYWWGQMYFVKREGDRNSW